MDEVGWLFGNDALARTEAYGSDGPQTVADKSGTGRTTNYRTTRRRIPLGRRRLAWIALLTAMVAAGALLAAPASRMSLARPIRDGLYNLGLTARSSDVEDLEADVQRLRSGIRRSDREQVQEALRAATTGFDALDPAERSAVKQDVELELLRARQFLAPETTPRRPLVRPPWS